MTPCFVACPALCIFCLYMFAQSTDLFDQLPWRYSGYHVIFHMYMDCGVFLFFHFLYMVLQANSLNYSIYGCPTVSQL